MARMLMNLRDVPADEYEEVCGLLEQHALEHYRIEPSRWGLHSGGLWLVDDARLAEAQRLLADYQASRAVRAREEWRSAKAAGKVPGLLDQLRLQPMRLLILVLALLGVLALSVLPFIWLMS